MDKTPCDVNTKEIKLLEERVTKLEQQREKDKEQLFELDKSLNGFILEMKHISEDLKSVVKNFKEAVSRQNVANEKELNNLKEQVKNQGTEIKALETKLEHETIEKDADNWKNFVKYVLTAILGAGLALIFARIGLS